VNNPPAPPNAARPSGNAMTWLLLALVVAAIGMVGWWAFFAPGVRGAPEVRVISGGVGGGAPPVPAASPSQGGTNGAGLAPSMSPAPPLVEPSPPAATPRTPPPPQ